MKCTSITIHAFRWIFFLHMVLKPWLKNNFELEISSIFSISSVKSVNLYVLVTALSSLMYNSIPSLDDIRWHDNMLLYCGHYIFVTHNLIYSLGEVSHTWLEELLGWWKFIIIDLKWIEPQISLFNNNRGFLRDIFSSSTHCIL